MSTLLFKMPTEIEPKRDSRFSVEFPIELNIESYLVQSISKPKLVNGKWENITTTLLDVVHPSTSDTIFKLIDYCKKNKSGIFSKKKPLFTIKLKSLDATGFELEAWYINIEKLISVDFGNYDYGSNDIQKIKVVLKPLDCRLV